MRGTKPVSCPQQRSIHLHPCCSDVSWLHTREPHVAWVCLVASLVEAHTIAERADRLEMLWLTSGALSLICGGRAAKTENCSCSLGIFRCLCCSFLRGKPEAAMRNFQSNTVSSPKDVAAGRRIANLPRLVTRGTVRVSRPGGCAG